MGLTEHSAPKSFEDLEDATEETKEVNVESEKSE